MPGLVALDEDGDLAFDDRRLDRVERGEHPGDRARPGVRVVRQQARMALGDVEHDRPGLEEGEIAVLVGRDLAEGVQRQVRGLLHLARRRRGGRRRAGPPPRAPSGRACRAPGPCRDRASVAKAVMVGGMGRLLVEREDQLVGMLSSRWGESGNPRRRRTLIWYYCPSTAARVLSRAFFCAGDDGTATVAGSTACACLGLAHLA